MYAASADFPYSCNELLIHGADLTLTNDYNQDAYTLTTTNNCKLGKNTSKTIQDLLTWSCSLSNYSFDIFDTDSLFIMWNRGDVIT